MLSLATIALAATVQPDFGPMRDHAWQEPVNAAHDIEIRKGHVTAEDAEPASDAQFLRYLPESNSLFEFVALGFDDNGLSQIIYPVHLPTPGTGAEKRLEALPDRFDAVRGWLTNHFGEPAAFTAATDDGDPQFGDVRMLLEQDNYRFFYTWCGRDANAFLNAQRNDGGTPIVVASVESPARPVDPKDVAMGHGCPQSPPG